MNKFISAFYYGNIFLGICAVALCIETNLITGIELNVFPFYLLIFFCTCIYYTMIYVRSVGTKNYNDRTLWYRKYLFTIKIALKYSGVLVGLFLLFLIGKNLKTFFLLSPLQLILIIALPLIAAWYTVAPGFFKIKKIRQIGWIKPFIVGLTWAGWVTVYPVIILNVQSKLAPAFSLLTLLLFWLQDFLFFSVNAIIFDIKDYRTDFYYNLNTYPVILGIRNTFRFIVLPVTFLNVIVFFLFQLERNFTLPQTLIQLIPYALLILIIITYRQNRSLLYYLVAVDGLVFAKAVCGITSIVLFKK